MTFEQHLIRIAAAEVGVKEWPPRSNRGERVSLYQSYDDLPGDGYAWCASFVIYCLTNAVKKASNGRIENWAYRSPSVGNQLAYARKHGAVVDKPVSGSLACFDWDSLNGPNKGDWPDHIGIVISTSTKHAREILGRQLEHIIDDAIARFGRISKGEFWTIEGNTAVGDDSNGGQVMVRKRSISQVEGFIVPERLVDLPPATRPKAFVVGRRGTKDAYPISLRDKRAIRRAMRKVPVLSKLIFVRRVR